METKVVLLFSKHCCPGNRAEVASCRLEFVLTFQSEVMPFFRALVGVETFVKSNI